MTKHEEKSRKEKYVFQRFQSNYKDMPAGEAFFDDKPDVIFTTASGETIGIELTECIYDERLMKDSEFQIKFNEKVIAKLDPLLPYNFHLDIDLDNQNPLRQNQIETTITEVIDISIKEFKNLQPYESKYLQQLNVDWSEASPNIRRYFRDLGYRKLPIGISRIQINRYDILTKSLHSESKGGMVPDFTQDHLNTILIKKEKALKNYKPCDKQWLVIDEGADFYSYMNAIKIEKGFDTKFEKVFMYRRWNSEVIIFK